MALMQINPGVILWTLIIFAVLLGVLTPLLWRPILKMVRDREKRIRDSLDQADNAKAEAERTLAEQKDLSRKNREEATEFLRKAREESERVGTELLAKSRRESDEQLERARRQIDEEKLRAIDAVRAEAVELALAAASHLLQKSVDQESQRDLVQRYIDELPKNLQRQ